MDENDIQNQNNTQPETQPEAKPEKTFTQEEVNKIIGERLARVKAGKMDAGDDLAERERILEEKEKAVAMRENRIKCSELLREKGYQAELLDILDTGNPDKFIEQAGKLADLAEKAKGAEEAPKKKVYPGTIGGSSRPINQEGAPFANTQHIPRKNY